MTSPKITVIIPVYNVEKYLSKCVDSVIEQTYKNLEIILVDDGSPDKSPAICDAYAKKDRRIKVIHKENGGLSSARNAGLDTASGDYVGFVDSDDWIEPDMYEYMINLCLKEDACIARCAFINENEDEENHKNISNNKENLHTISGDDLIIELVNGEWNEGIMCNKLYRKCLFDGLRFKEGITIEDCLMNYYVFKQNVKMISSDIIKYHYLQRMGSITKSNFSEKSFDIIKVAQEITDGEVGNSNTYRFCVRRLLKYNVIYLKTCIAYEKIFSINDMVNTIKKYKDNVFNDDIYTMQFKVKVFLICYFPLIYKLCVRAKALLNSVDSKDNFCN